MKPEKKMSKSQEGFRKKGATKDKIEDSIILRLLEKYTQPKDLSKSNDFKRVEIKKQAA